MEGREGGRGGAEAVHSCCQGDAAELGPALASRASGPKTERARLSGSMRCGQWGGVRGTIPGRGGGQPPPSPPAVGQAAEGKGKEMENQQRQNMYASPLPIHHPTHPGRRWGVGLREGVGAGISPLSFLCWKMKTARAPPPRASVRMARDGVWEALSRCYMRGGSNQAGWLRRAWVGGGEGVGERRDPGAKPTLYSHLSCFPKDSPTH